MLSFKFWPHCVFEFYTPGPTDCICKATVIANDAWAKSASTLPRWKNLMEEKVKVGGEKKERKNKQSGSTSRWDIPLEGWLDWGRVSRPSDLITITSIKRDFAPAGWGKGEPGKDILLLPLFQETTSKSAEAMIGSRVSGEFANHSIASLAEGNDERLSGVGMMDGCSRWGMDEGTKEGNDARRSRGGDAGVGRERAASFSSVGGWTGVFGRSFSRRQLDKVIGNQLKKDPKKTRQPIGRGLAKVLPLPSTAIILKYTMGAA